MNANREKLMVLRREELCDAYRAGWAASMAGLDGRFHNPHEPRTETHAAWTHGFLDAMEADDDDKCAPDCAGY
jgi:hypothetical protein